MTAFDVKARFAWSPWILRFGEDF